MIVYVNGAATQVAAGVTIGAYIDQLGRGRKGLAAALGDTVIRRSLWDETVLTEDARVEILTAAQGG